MTYRSATVLLNFLFLFTSAPLLHAQSSYAGGAVIVRLADDPGTRCIDVRSDRISAVVRRFTTPLTKSWFRQDTAIGLVVGTALEGRTGGASERVSFQRTYVANLRNYEGVEGIVSVPIEPRLFTGFPLSSGDDIYEVAEIDFRITNLTRPTPLKMVVESLAELTDNLPLPQNPFTDSFKFFAVYSNDLIDRATEANPDDAALAGQFTLQFSSSGQCLGDQETTGTKAIIFGGSGDGMLDINEISSYCFEAQLQPAFVLRYSDRAPNGDCSNDTSRVLANPHIAVYLNAVPQSLSATPAEISNLMRDASNIGSATVSPDVADAMRALEQCRSNGILESECF